MTTTAETTQPDLASTSLTTSIATLWSRWLAATAAYHAVSSTDARAVPCSYDAELLALRLAAIPAETLDDTRPKVIVAAWHRRYGTSSDIDHALEAAIAVDLLRLQPRLDPACN